MSNRVFADISSNNPYFNAAAYAADGHVLISIKVSQGSHYVNADWHAWAHQAHIHKVAVAHYHFADGGGYGQGEDQAHFFLDNLHTSKVYHQRYDRIVLDIEQMSKCTDPVGFVKGFERVCIERGHHSLILYSDAGYLEQYGVGLRPSSGKLWVAAYPTLPHGWWGDNPWAHQYTDDATEPLHDKAVGVLGPHDMSVLSSGAYVWQKLHHPR